MKEQNVKEQSIKLLNQGVADELWAVHQYMYFHFHCDDQGYDLLADIFKKTAIAEMVHVEEFAERILFLGGTIELEAAREVSKVHEVREMLEMALRMEEEAIDFYNQSANLCTKDGDAGSRVIFERLVSDEEKHADQFEIQLKHLDRFGEHYLVLQSIERSRSLARGEAAE